MNYKFKAITKNEEKEEYLENNAGIFIELLNNCYNLEKSYSSIEFLIAIYLFVYITIML